MKISNKLIFSYLGLIVLIAMMGTLAVTQHFRFSQINDHIELNLEEVAGVTGVAYHVQRIKSNLREIFLSIGENNSEEIDNLVKSIRLSNKELIESLIRWKKATEEEKKLEAGGKYEQEEAEELEEIEKLYPQVETFQKNVNQILIFVGARQFDQARAFFETETESFSRELQQNVKHIEKEIYEEIEEKMKETQKNSHRNSKNMVLLAGFAVLAAAMFSFLITAHLMGAIQRLRQAAAALSQNHLDTVIDTRAQDELGDLARSFEQMRLELKKNIQSLTEEIETRKKMQETVAQSEKMSAIGQLAAGIAHEINNPIGVILGFAQAMVKRLQPQDPYEQPLRSIEREATRCKDLVRDLLSFSRSAKGEKEKVSLTEAIESALTLIEAQTKVKEIRLQKDLQPNLPVMRANRVQIQQIVINLAQNAIDAMPRGGTLTVRAHGQNNRVEIEVKDTGEGIHPDIQSKIFDPFFTTKEVGKGTGLGLSLVYEIVESHGGKITMESKVNEGTVFQVFLPLDSNSPE